MKRVFYYIRNNEARAPRTLPVVKLFKWHHLCLAINVTNPSAQVVLDSQVSPCTKHALNSFVIINTKVTLQSVVLCNEYLRP